MFLRILLALAIAMGGASIAVSFLKVKPRIEKAEKGEKDNMQKYQAEVAAKGRVVAELNTTKQTLETTQNELTTTKTSLAAKTTEAEAATAKAAGLEGELAKSKAETQKVIAASKDFFDFGKSVPEIKTTYANLEQRTKERDVFSSENKILQVQVNKLENRIREIDKNSVLAPAVRLPLGLSGKVTSVDPRYEFVIITVGARQGAKVDGEMMVTRGGELIGKVRIATVETDYSVANVIQAWKKKDVVEGDTVVVQ
jgi:hypothetical protein